MWLWIKATIIGVAKIILSLAIVVLLSLLILATSAFASNLPIVHPILGKIIAGFAILFVVASVITTFALIISEEHDNLKKGE